MADLRDLTDDANVRIGRIVHLDTAICAGDVDFDLEEYLTEHADHLGWDLAGYPDVAEFLYDTGRDRGWVIEAHTPVPFSFSDDGTSYGYSWGHYAIGVFHTDTYEAGVEAACAWAATVRAQARERATQTA